MKNAYQATIEKDIQNKFVRKLDQEEIDKTENDTQWYLPHHPVKHPHKPGKVRRVCNAASKFKGVSLNDKLLSGPDLNAESSPILGLEWIIDADSLQVCRGPNKGCPNEVTQRVVLSFVSSVFDPMGIFAPFTMRMRMLLKSIWIRFGQSWDENINEEDKRTFLEWVKEMQAIKQRSLPRKYFSNIPKNV